MNHDESSQPNAIPGSHLSRPETSFDDSTRLDGVVTLTVLGLVWCSPDNSPIRSSRSDGLVDDVDFSPSWVTFGC